MSSNRVVLGVVASTLMLFALNEPARGQPMPSLRTAVQSGLPRTPAPSPGMTFVVRGLRSDHGQVMGGLFDNAQRWGHHGQEAATCRASIRSGIARCVFRELRPGRYAFAFAHDEDRDGQFDRDFLGIPAEGYGFSNNVRPSLSIPSFDSASFSFGRGRSVEQVVVTRYGI